MAGSAEEAPGTRPSHTSALHFQLYRRGVESAVRWRVLSANNRDMGRCLIDYADESGCVTGIADFLANLNSLVPGLVRAADNRWSFRFLRGDDVIVSSGRGFDRRTRCVQASARFLELVPEAELRPGVALLAPSRRPRPAERADPVRRPNVAPRWAPVHAESPAESSRAAVLAVSRELPRLAARRRAGH